MAKSKRFFELLGDAVADLRQHGYDSQARLDAWISRLRAAAVSQLTSPEVIERAIRRTLTTTYRGMLGEAAIARIHPGVSRFTVLALEPQMQAELNLRVQAASNLIRLNRSRMVDLVEQRFSGWATSIPAGGSEVVDVRKVKSDIYKPLQRLPFEERRVHIDQGAKMLGALSELVAVSTNAIAGAWHSRYRQPGYDYREDHKDRDGLIYLVPGSWALREGLIKPVNGYVTDITRPNEEPFCKCSYRWIYNLRSLPADMLTEKGKKKLAEVRRDA